MYFVSILYTHPHWMKSMTKHLDTLVPLNNWIQSLLGSNEKITPQLLNGEIRKWNWIYWIDDLLKVDGRGLPDFRQHTPRVEIKRRSCRKNDAVRNQLHHMRCHRIREVQGTRFNEAQADETFHRQDESLQFLEKDIRVSCYPFRIQSSHSTLHFWAPGNQN